jgi:hypothetical protein
MGSPILGPHFSLPGPHSPKLPPLRPTRSPADRPPEACQAGDPQTFTISTGPRCSGLDRPAQACAPKTCQTGDPHMHDLHSVGTHPQACTSPLGRASQAYQASNPQAFTISISLAAPFRHARPMLQRPARLPQQQASTHRPVGPHPPTTHSRRAPNLPRRHRQA